VKLPRLRTVLLAPLVLLALAWVALAIFVATQGEAVPEPVAVFHYISSSDISADSRTMWARVKVEATQIGRAMLEAAARGDEFENGDKLGTRRIIRYSDAYRLSRPNS
jgi:hypothetical protein